MSKGSFNPKIRLLGQKVCYIVVRARYISIGTDGCQKILILRPSLTFRFTWDLPPMIVTVHYMYVFLTNCPQTISQRQYKQTP